MKLTIIPSDNVIVKDNFAISDINLLLCGIPANIHALQFNGVDGHLEYTDGTFNSFFTDLPDWAKLCSDAHDIAKEALENPPAKTQEETAETIRITRDGLLFECDWWMLSDRTATQGQIDYRQALRDITSQTTFPASVVWPIKPE
mgnify:CR=1 FL=1